MTKAQQDLYMWVQQPGTVYSLQEILVKLKNYELQEIIRDTRGPEAKIAWAELGRRLGFADITFRFRSVGKLTVDINNAVLSSGLGGPE